jgi:hypothetical protein
MKEPPNLREFRFRTINCGTEDSDRLPLFRELWPDKPINPVWLRRAYICVVDKAQVVGFGSLTIKNSLWQEGAIGHIDERIVRHEYRGRNIGTLLLSRLEALNAEG